MDKADTYVVQYKVGSQDDDRVPCYLLSDAGSSLSAFTRVVGYLFNIRNGRI
jgi:hypothetical protein